MFDAKNVNVYLTCSLVNVFNTSSVARLIGGPIRKWRAFFHVVHFFQLSVGKLAKLGIICEQDTHW